MQRWKGAAHCIAGRAETCSMTRFNRHNPRWCVLSCPPSVHLGDVDAHGRFGGLGRLQKMEMKMISVVEAESLIHPTFTIYPPLFYIRPNSDGYEEASKMNLPS